MDSRQKTSLWYYNQIPVSEDMFAKFLGDSFELADNKFSKFTSEKVVFPIPKGQEAIIPDWILSRNTFKRVTLSEQRVLQTACWNYMLLNNAALRDGLTYNRVDVLKLHQEFFQNMRYIDFGKMLNSGETILQGAYNHFYDVALSFLFSDASLANCTDEYSTLSHYLNPKLRGSVRNIMGDELCDVLDHLTTCDKDDIAPTCVKLYDLLFKDEQEQSNSQNENQQQDEDQNSPDETQPNKQKSDVGQPPVDFDKLAKSAQSTFNKEAINQLQDNIQQTNKKPTNDKEHLAVDMQFSASTSDFAVKRHDVLDVQRKLEYNRAYPTIGTFQGLGKHLRLLKVIKDRPIEPEIYGNELLENSLYRFKIDRRIFGTYEDDEVQIARKWNIVVDFSSSMGDIVRSVNKPLWSYALENAHSAFISLREAREQVSIYAHQEFRGCNLVHIASNHNPDIDTRFFTARHWYGGGTGDHKILPYVAKYEFNPHDEMKIIVMISDGEPGAGKSVMKSVVDQLRRVGYVIFAVSVVKGVVNSNNFIYGEDWNIDASSGNVDQKLRELFLRIIGEYK